MCGYLFKCIRINPQKGTMTKPTSWYQFVVRFSAPWKYYGMSEINQCPLLQITVDQHESEKTSIIR